MHWGWEAGGAYVVPAFADCINFQSLASFVTSLFRPFGSHAEHEICVADFWLHSAIMRAFNSFLMSWGIGELEML